MIVAQLTEVATRRKIVCEIGHMVSHWRAFWYYEPASIQDTIQMNLIRQKMAAKQTAISSVENWLEGLLDTNCYKEIFAQSATLS